MLKCAIGLALIIDLLRWFLQRGNQRVVGSAPTACKEQCMNISSGRRFGSLSLILGPYHRFRPGCDTFEE